jgi:signal transduction histidine kinase|tara:strand:- start:24790 stop:25527 length:738 start_codon:yes stop_codon:yes gene_type:complete
MLVDVTPVSADDLLHVFGHDTMLVRPPRKTRQAARQTLGERLSSPLSAMLGQARLIRDHGTYDAFAADIIHACEHLGRVLVDLDQQEETEIHAARGDVRRIVREVWAMFLPAADAAGVTLLLQGGEGPAIVARTGRKRLRQILINLLSNAIKFSEHGGAVEVALQAGDPVYIRVSDSGPGIPPADRERIFSRFERLQSEIEGKGLGLAIARAHATELGGRLYVEDPAADGPCNGAVFVLELPLEG